jgi:exopolysaccharide biosynthesis predicted pyruvyltransferase EpsI
MIDSQPGLPTLGGLETRLHMYRGKVAYVIPMIDESGRVLGNNGDHLMISVFRMVLTHLEIRTSTNPELADLVVVPPNGALLEAYGFPALLAERLKRFKDVPLVIFPSSALFNSVDPSFMFAERSAPTLWILREKNSLRHLSDRWSAGLQNSGVELTLDHDIVASGHQFVRSLLPGNISNSTTLIGARVDREARPFASESASSASGTFASRAARGAASKIPYGPWFTAAVRVARRAKQHSASDALIRALPDAEKFVVENAVGHRVEIDISATQYATFPEYGRELRRAGLVVTNRLHIALPAAILGKRVILVEAGYHKLSGVYDQSLTTLPSVSLVNQRA